MILLLIPVSQYHSIKEKNISGRYLTLDKVSPLLEKLPGIFRVETIGQSVKGAPLYQVGVGKGDLRILMWSQMHGNETTTTKAVLDLLGYFRLASGKAGAILETCTICILPMLNPDGAASYTRTNANDADLNRDAQLLSQPESRALRKAYDDFQPHFCFNLHDQRTIFNVGESPKPATLSFLAPAHDKARTVSDSRADSMKLIAAINYSLQQLIPGQVGRYDDSFNLNCVGDTFQSLNTPTVLFEAGHFPGDYEREQTRALVFQALVSALMAIAESSFRTFNLHDYLAIPENNKRFLDILVKNPREIHPQWEADIRIGIQFKEVLQEGMICFVPQFQEAGLLRDKFGHKTYDASREADRLQIRQEEALLAILI